MMGFFGDLFGTSDQEISMQPWGPVRQPLENIIGAGGYAEELFRNYFADPSQWIAPMSQTTMNATDIMSKLASTPYQPSPYYPGAAPYATPPQLPTIPGYTAPTVENVDLAAWYSMIPQISQTEQITSPAEQMLPWLSELVTYNPDFSSVQNNVAAPQITMGTVTGNPYLDSQIATAQRNLTNQFVDVTGALRKDLLENILPGIGQSAQSVGQFGSGRQGIVEGKALQAYEDAIGKELGRFGQWITDIESTMRGQAYDTDRALAMQQALAQGGIDLQTLLANQQTGLSVADLMQQGALANQSTALQGGISFADLMQGAALANQQTWLQTNLAQSQLAQQGLLAGFGFEAQQALQNAALQQQGGLAGYDALTRSLLQQPGFDLQAALANLAANVDLSGIAAQSQNAANQAAVAAQGNQITATNQLAQQGWLEQMLNQNTMQAPWNILNQYANMVLQGANTGQTQTQPGPGLFNSPFMDMLGLGLSIYGGMGGAPGVPMTGQPYINPTSMVA